MPSKFEIGRRNVQNLGAELFQYPSNNELARFQQIAGIVDTLPLRKTKDGEMSLTAYFSHNGQETSLTVKTSSLQQGRENQPRIIYLPRYGEESHRTRKLLDIPSSADLHIEGIDTFHSVTNIETLLSSATASQFGYALGLRMIRERIQDARDHNQRVALIGFSYGANLISAYLSQSPDELPDAIVEVLGGDIRASTLISPYRDAYDVRTLEAIRMNPDVFPLQRPLSGAVRFRTAAVINIIDDQVPDQYVIWGNAAYRKYIHGGHFSSLFRNRESISKFVDEHLRALLFEK